MLLTLATQVTTEAEASKQKGMLGTAPSKQAVHGQSWQSTPEATGYQALTRVCPSGYRLVLRHLGKSDIIKSTELILNFMGLFSF